MKKFLISISLVLVSLTAILFGGCGIDRYFKDPWKYKKEENGFYYYLVGVNEGVAGVGNKADYAVILGYKYLSETIEELVIPEKLGGYDVKQIGTAYTVYISAPTTYYGINAENIKKVVINHEIGIPDLGLENFKGDLIINAPIRLDWYYLFNCYIEINVETPNITISGKEYDTYLSTHEESIKYDHPNTKNVKFDAEGGQQKTYAVVTQNGILREPEVPTKEGFTFDGWYTDEQYETKWNFEEDRLTTNLTLYAKWI